MAKRLQERDIFYVPYKEKFFFGKLPMDISERILKKEYLSSLQFYDGCYLIGVYEGIYDEPVLTSSKFIIPSTYTLKKYFYSKNYKTDWHFYKSENIDYKKDITFPEYLRSIHRVGICFASGGIIIPTQLTRKDFEEVFDVTGTVNMGYYSVIDYACHYAGRDDLMPFIPYGFLERQDFRFAGEKRNIVYRQIGEDPNISYYELALKHGFDLGRFYE